MHRWEEEEEETKNFDARPVANEQHCSSDWNGYLVNSSARRLSVVFGPSSHLQIDASND